jgi:hypothetical protein
MYILMAVDTENNILFYTGKSGMDWLSFRHENAFYYPTRELALERAKRFNCMEPVHGYRFMVQSCVPSHSS